MKPSILHIDTDMSLRGGQKQAIYLYESLIKKGIKTNFICRKGSEIEKYFINNNINFFSYSILSTYSLLLALKIARFSKQHGYNIIHCHSSNSLNIGMLVNLFYRRVKLIGSRRVVFPVKNIMKYNSSLVDKIITVSDAVNNQMIKSGVDSNKLIVIHDGVYTDTLVDIKPAGLKAQNEFANSFIIGTAAAFSKEKNYPVLVEAARIICKDYPEIKFVFLGKGALFDEIKSMINEYNLINNVYLLGFVDNPLEYNIEFDIFVSASRAEGLGTSILDAMALGKPIIASRTGGIPEIVHHNVNGILFNSGNATELSDAIIKLYNDKDRRGSMARNSLKIVKNFDIKQTVEKTNRLYEELLNGEY